MKIFLFTVVCIALTLSACATPYGTYGISGGYTDSRIEVSCRAAISGYMLRRLEVDYSLNPEEYHLALQNIESLASAESADLAPGYKRIKGLA